MQAWSHVVWPSVVAGVHGAALAWTLLMHPGAGVLEIFPDAADVWRLYQHSSEWAGLIYTSYISNASQLHGDKLHVDIMQTVSLVQALVQAVLDI